MTTKISITELRYADNDAIVAHTESDLQLAGCDFKKAQVLHQPKPGLQADQVQHPTIKVKGELLSNVKTSLI